MTELRPRSLGEILDAALVLALRGAVPSLRTVALVMTPFVLLDVALRSRLPQHDLPRWTVAEEVVALALAALLACFILDVFRSIADDRRVSTPASLLRAARAWPAALIATYLFLGSTYAFTRSFWKWADTDSGAQPSTGWELLLGLVVIVLVLTPLLLAWVTAHYAWGWGLSVLADSKKRSFAAVFSGLRAILRSPRRRVLSELSFTFGLLLVNLLAELSFATKAEFVEIPRATFLAGVVFHLFARTMIGLYFLAFVFLARRDAAIRSEGLDLDVELTRLEAAS